MKGIAYWERELRFYEDSLERARYKRHKLFIDWYESEISTIKAKIKELKSCIPT